MPTSNFLRFTNAERMDEELLLEVPLVGGLQWSSVCLLFSPIFASNSTLLKLKIVGMASSLRSSLRSLKAGPILF